MYIEYWINQLISILSVLNNKYFKSSICCHTYTVLYKWDGLYYITYEMPTNKEKVIYN